MIAFLMLLLIGLIILLIYGINSSVEFSKQEKSDRSDFITNLTKSNELLMSKYGSMDYNIQWQEMNGSLKYKYNSLRIFEAAQKVIINNMEYSFKDIISVIFSDADNVISTTTKTSTGNMVGRAVVGGVLLGGVGAIIGGTTAKTETTQNKDTLLKYAIKITINNINNPFIVLNFDRWCRITNDGSVILETEDSIKHILGELNAILSIIVKRNDKS